MDFYSASIDYHSFKTLFDRVFDMIRFDSSYHILNNDADILFSVLSVVSIISLQESLQFLYLNHSIEFRYILLNANLLIYTEKQEWGINDTLFHYSFLKPNTHIPADTPHQYQSLSIIHIEWKCFDNKKIAVFVMPKTVPHHRKMRAQK